MLVTESESAEPIIRTVPGNKIRVIFQKVILVIRSSKREFLIY
jgi:hypothetical protein